MARVLIVDDDQSIVRMISLLLLCESIEPVPAYDGRQGLRAIELARPDAVILDLQMPVMDGKAFLKQARRAGYKGTVVVCSAAGAIAAQRELGADAAFEKPFDPDDLVASIKGLLERDAT